MGDGLRLLLSLSLSGSLVAIMLLACRPLFRRLGQTWHYYIWLVVVIRLLLPVALPVNPVGQLFAPEVPEAGIIQEERSRAGEGASSAETEPEAAMIPNYQQAALTPQPFFSFDILPLWAVVALVLLVRKVTDYHSFIRFVRAGSKVPENDSLAESLARARELAGLTKTPPIFINPMVTSPMVVGVFRPFIAVPDESASSLIFLHELTHWRRKDAWYKWLVQLAVCIHWFNPLVYVMRREIEKRSELACDEAVLRRLNGENRRQYGDTLLESVKRGGQYENAVISVPLNADAKLLKERLGSIMRYEKPAKRQIFWAAFATLSVTVGALLCGCAALAKPVEQSAKTRIVPSAAEKVLGEATLTKADHTSGPEVDGYTDNWSMKEIHTLNQYFSANSFFENQYIFELGWDVDTTQYTVTRQIGQDMPTTVAFTNRTKVHAGNQELLKAVGQAIARSNATRRRHSIVAPIVLSVSGPYQENADQLVEKFYKEKRLVEFTAVADKAGPETVDAYCEKAYQDDRIDYFTMISHGMSSKQADQLRKAATKDNKVDFFYLISDSLDQTVAVEIARQAYEEGKIDFFYAVQDALSREEQGALARKAMEEGKIDFFYALSDSLSQDDQAALAKKAFQTGKIEFFYALSDSLSIEERAALAKQAFESGKIEFFYVLSEALTKQEKAELAQKAFTEKKIEFLYALTD